MKTLAVWMLGAALFLAAGAQAARYSWEEPFPGATPSHYDSKTGKPVYLIQDPAPSTPAEAPELKKWSFAFWSGGATGDLTEVINEYQATAKWIKTQYGAYFPVFSYNVTKGAIGYFTGLDLGYRLTPYAGLGIKTGYLTTPDVTATISGTGSWVMSSTSTMKGSVIPFLVGGWVQTKTGNSWEFRGSLYGGPGWANIHIDESMSLIATSVSSSNVSYNLESNAMFFDLKGRVGYWFNETFSLFLDLGYHFYNASEIRYAANVDTTGDGVADHSKGELFESVNGGAVPFNTSGFSSTSGLSFNF